MEDRLKYIAQDLAAIAEHMKAIQTHLDNIEEATDLNVSVDDWKDL